VYAEEHRGLPLDIGGGDDAERALRELCARLTRQGWADNDENADAGRENEGDKETAVRCGVLDQRGRHSPAVHGNGVSSRV
jgi:hypothetical protein